MSLSLIRIIKFAGRGQYQIFKSLYPIPSSYEGGYMHESYADTVTIVGHTLSIKLQIVMPLGLGEKSVHLSAHELLFSFRNQRNTCIL